MLNCQLIGEKKDYEYEYIRERRIDCVDKIAQASPSEKKKGRLGKKIYIKVKRGKLDGVVGSKSKTGEKGEKERGVYRVCAFYSSSYVQAPP